MTEASGERESALRSDLESLRIDRGAAAPRARRRRGRWFWYAALLLVGAGVAARLLMPRAVTVSVAAATQSAANAGAMMPVLSGSGYIVTGDRYISVGVRVPGRIERYFVEEGQTIRQNDPLVQIDDRDYRAAVARADATLAVARANQQLADAELKRGRALRTGKVISDQELDVLENKAAVGRATVEQVTAELEQSRVNLEYTLLRSPSDGVILAKLKEVGEIAVPGGFAGSGDLIRLANLADLRAEVDVNEADLNRVRLGQPAEVTPDAYPDARYAAKVVKLYPQVDRQKGTLKVEVQIPAPDARLLPDMSARIAFLEPLPPEVASQPSVLIPSAAMRRDRAGVPFVWVVRDGHVYKTAVEVAAATGDPVRVTRGLSGAEVVVVSDEEGLAEGTAVKPTN